MLPSDLLIYHYRGEEIVPKRLPLSAAWLELAAEIINLFQEAVGKTRGGLETQLHILEGAETDYRIKRGLAHLLFTGFCDYQVVSPIEPSVLRRLAFREARGHVPSEDTTHWVLQRLADKLSEESGNSVHLEQVRGGLYADLKQNHCLLSFDAPTPAQLIHRYNLAQAQGVLYRAEHIVITAYRNDPGEYKQLFRFLKLFGLMAYIEGDADQGYSITIDGPASLFRASSRYGTDIAKFLPALLQVSKWKMEAQLLPKKGYDGKLRRGLYSLDSSCGLVSHYKQGNTYDSAVEEAFASRWAKTKTDWRLEREVELVPIPGSVMIPDFRLVHPKHTPYLFEIVGYWRPEYLRKKFAQVHKAERDDLILAISERLNLGKAGIDVSKVRAEVIWFKGRIEPKRVLECLAA